MAGASDKARFYLEQSVPELKEFRRKDIFSKHEVSSIVKKRSDFEHKLNARGSHSSDYANYAAYEMNLESLRRKRAKRLGVKTASHLGQRRIFFILERATRKFHGDTDLWMQYVGFARKQKSNSKVSSILTQMVRLFPTKPEIWIYAAKYSLEERGDMAEARAFMHKGLRFCKNSEELWIEYARLEMICIARLAARSKILGLHQLRDSESHVQNGAEDVHADLVDMSPTTVKDVNPSHVGESGKGQDVLGKLDYNTAESDAILLAIFEAAMKQFEHDSYLASVFFDMVAEYDVETRQGILAHIIHSMQLTAPNSFEFLARFTLQPVIGLDPTGAEFPMSLAISLDRLEPALQRLETSQCRQRFGDYVADWIRKVLAVDNLDGDIGKVLQIALRKVHRQSQTMGT